jgi:hypothetical protein
VTRPHEDERDDDWRGALSESERAPHSEKSKATNRAILVGLVLGALPPVLLIALVIVLATASGRASTGSESSHATQWGALLAVIGEITVGGPLTLVGLGCLFSRSATRAFGIALLMTTFLGALVILMVAYALR